MILYTLLIPIITCAFLFIFHKKKTVIWEYMLILGPSIFFILLLNTILIHNRTSDKMYKSFLIKEIRKYESWNKYIYKKCISCRTIGKVTHCKTYSCNYVKNYPEYKVMIDDQNQEYTISDNNYSFIKNKFNTPNIFFDLHRAYYTKNGNMYSNSWDRNINNSFVITKEESYENKTQAFHQLFFIEDIDNAEKIKWKLYDYPEIDNYTQPVVLGKKIDQYTNTKLQAINGNAGSKLNLKLFILFFYDQPQKVAFKQRSYWEGGNKNELIICVGVDSLTGKTNWVQSFSWCDKSDINEKCELLFKIGVVPDLKIIANDIEKNVLVYWRAKDFHDFDYLQVEVTSIQLKIIMLILLFYNICISIWIIKNEFHNILELKNGKL